MPPAAKGHQTLSAYISSRFDEFSLPARVGARADEQIRNVAAYVAENAGG